jgi:Na+/H+-dicarboxylate symporter
MSLTLRVLLGLILGLGLGAVLAAFAPGSVEPVLAFADPIGGMWLDSLRMTIVPLIFSLLVVGMSQAASTARGGGVAGQAFGWFLILLLVSSVASLAAMSGLLSLFPVPPDQAAALRATAPDVTQALKDNPSAATLIRGFIPTNPVAAAAEGAMAPLVFFALIFGAAASRISPELRDHMTTVFEAVIQTMLVVVRWILWLGPIGVFALGLVVGAKAGAGAAGTLLGYIIMASSMGAMIAVIAFVLAVVLGGVSPLTLARAVGPALAVAFSTQSSLASLPAMVEGVRNLGVPERVAGVVLPLAVSLFRFTSPAVNFAAAVYSAHVFGIHFDAVTLGVGIAVALAVSVASVGLPGQITFIASVGAICAAMGIPLGILPLLLAVEVIPDIGRTVGNVMGDMAVTLVVNRRTAKSGPGQTAP